MSKFDECMTQYTAAFDKLGKPYDADLLRKVAKGLGPSIYNTDSSKVSSSDKAELDRVKTNFLIKKLGLNEGPELDQAITKVVDWFGKGERNKYRAVFYYQLVQHFDKAAIYK